MRWLRLPVLRSPELLDHGTAIESGVGGFRNSAPTEAHYEVLLCGEASSYPLAGRLFPLNLDSMVAVIADLTGIPKSATKLWVLEQTIGVDQTVRVVPHVFAGGGVPMRLVVRRAS